MSVLSDDLPLDPTRLFLAALIVVIFVLCFMPVPISPVELVGGVLPDAGGR